MAICKPTTTIINLQLPVSIPISHCDECNGNLIQTSHELVCDACGLVFESTTFLPDYMKSDFDKGLYNHTPFFYREKHDLFSDKGIHETLMGPFRVKQIISKEQKKYFRYLARLNRHTTQIGQFHYFHMLEVLHEVNLQLNLSKIIRRNIIYLYRKATKNHPSGNNTSVLALCIYNVLCEHKQIVELQDILLLFKELNHPITDQRIKNIRKTYPILAKPIAIDFRSHIFKWCLRLPELFSESPALEGSLEIQAYYKMIELYSLKLYERCNRKQGIHRGHLAAASIYAAILLANTKYGLKHTISQERIGLFTNKTTYQIQFTYDYYIRPRILKYLPPKKQSDQVTK